MTKHIQWTEHPKKAMTFLKVRADVSFTHKSWFIIMTSDKAGLERKFEAEA